MMNKPERFSMFLKQGARTIEVPKPGESPIFGADMRYLIADSLHTMGLTGFYERTLLQYITLRGGVSYLKTGKITNIGGTVGAGFSFAIGSIFIIQPMAKVNFGSMQNNIMGVNINLGFAL